MRALAQWRINQILPIASSALSAARLRAVAPASPADTRLPVPSRAAQAPAGKHFARLFSQKYQRMDSDNAPSLAEYPYSRYYGGGKDHPVTRRVALTLCWKLAARAGDTPALFEPLGARQHHYRADRWGLRAVAIVAVPRRPAIRPAGAGPLLPIFGLVTRSGAPFIPAVPFNDGGEADGGRSLWLRGASGDRARIIEKAFAPKKVPVMAKRGPFIGKATEAEKSPGRARRLPS
jgi:hypothetical protein